MSASLVDRGLTPTERLPIISLVTPSLDQGRFIEQTIDSVLSQDYPRLEYMVIDGGSTDGTLAILESYKTRLAYVTSERDRGQADAINKGFARANGSLLGWLNSDDRLTPRALLTIAKAHRRWPEAILLGDVVNVFDPCSRKGWVTRQQDVTLENALTLWSSKMRWHQPGMFVPTEVARRAGDLDISLRYLFDRDWLIRLLRIAEVRYLDATVAEFRLHSASKTVKEAGEWPREIETVWARYRGDIPSRVRRRYDAAAQLACAAQFVSANALDVERARRYLGAAMRYYPGLFLRPGAAKIALLAWLPEGVASSMKHIRDKVRSMFETQ
jgi:glycosyltransferase involved in cell wall biosynthesis